MPEAITVTEKYDSRKITTGNNGSAELTYIISGTSDETTALSNLASTAPTSFQGFSRLSRQIEPLGDPTVTEKWEATVRYGVNNTAGSSSESGETSVFTFETGGGSQNVKQSISTINSYAPSGETAANFKGSINVTDNGTSQEVSGVDIVIPVYNFSETHYIDDTTVDSAYKGTIYSLTGKVNDDTFKGFPAGSLLFLGASGTKRGADYWELTFKFSASPNKTGLTVGDITGITKKGWEYLWVSYETKTDATAGRTVKVPASVYIEKVYDEGDFSGLGI